MIDNRNGKVVTFYSYKGGTGRTMALANVAWILAANGKRVLVVDWDLESPGLHRYFSPFIDSSALTSTEGVIDMIRQYEDATKEPQADPAYHLGYARVQLWAFSLKWDHFPAGGGIDYFSAGRQNDDYSGSIAGLNWDEFYEAQGGGAFFDALGEDMRRNYDYTLIDSRTGFSDVASICTMHLPDILVDCFTFSEQGIHGAADVARQVQRRSEPAIRILPVPMRVDPAENEKAEAGRLAAKYSFGDLPSHMSDAERDAYWNAMRVPYHAFYAYEESLATFGDLPGNKTSLLTSYETLTNYLTDGAVTAMPPMVEALRATVNARFKRREIVHELSLTFAPADRVWAEWLEHVLVGSGVRVVEPAAGSGASTSLSATTRTLRIVSRANAHLLPEPPAGREPLVVFVNDVAPQNGAYQSSVTLTGRDERDAAAAVLRLIGHMSVDLDGVMSGLRPRYPRAVPTVFNLPTPNVRFTGREGDLLGIREELVAGRRRLGETSAVVLRGMAGVGKTQVALEYAHRFASAYDVVWWVDADPFTFVDSQLIDLAAELGLPTQQAGAEAVRALRAELGRPDSGRRWLLIFDNAEDQRIEPFLPTGVGHVLLTSQTDRWSTLAQELPIEPFSREESIALIHKRNEYLPDADADRVAEAVGDLPIAVAGASAFLAASGMPVDRYLAELAEHGTRLLQQEEGPRKPGKPGEPGKPGDPGQPGKSVEMTWNVSLERLIEQSPGAYRLLELCSVLAPEIALDIVYSDGMANALTQVDPELFEPMVRASLVAQLSKLALIRIDRRNEHASGGEHTERAPVRQILVHRLLQDVVRRRMTIAHFEYIRHEVHMALATLKPKDVDEPKDWPAYRMLWPQLEASDAVQCESAAVRRIMIDRVRYLWLRGDLVRARRRAELIASTWAARVSSMTDPADRRSLQLNLLTLQFNLANVLRSLGFFAGSLKLDNEVLAKQTELLGADHPYALLTAGSLAGDLRALGRYQDALVRDQETFAIWTANVDDTHPRLVAALSNVATSHRLMGHFAEALRRDQEAFNKRRALYDEVHPFMINSTVNLARDLRDAGLYERSANLLRRLLAALIEDRGARSRDALNAKTNLAASIRATGNYAEAAALLDEAVDGLTSSLSEGLNESNPDTRAARLARALNAFSMGRFRDAEQEMIQVRASSEAPLGPTHPHILVCDVNLAVFARANGRLEEATRLLTDTTAALAEALGETHPFTLDAQTNLAICLASAGDRTTAARRLSETLVHVQKVFGADHPVTLRCEANLAQMKGSLPQSHVDRLSRSLGTQHPLVVEFVAGRYVPRTIDPHPY